MLRITCLAPDGHGQRVRVEGRLTEEVAGELDRVARTALAAFPRVVLDLGDVSFADHQGVELLQRLRRDGVEIAECSQFVRTLMNGGWS